MNKQNEIQDSIVNQAIQFYKTERHGYLDVSVRTGKCLISIKILREIYTLFLPTTLICYPDNRIKDSWINELKKWNYDNPFIEFVNFSSLHKYKGEFYDMVIVDEFPAVSSLELDYCQQIITNGKNTKCLALSGTISEDTKQEWGLKEIAKYTTEEGIQDGILSDYQITVHLVNLDTKVKTKNKKGKLLTEKQKYDNYSYVIAKMQKEGKNTMHLALARNRLSLSSIAKVNFTKKLLKDLQGKRTIVFTGLSDVADNLGIPSYHSKSSTNASFLAFQGGTIDKLALAQMAKMGVTFSSLDSVILLNFTYNEEESKQQLSRTLILDYKGKVADLHVICLNEPPEIKKVKESLSMLDKTKIKYL